MEPTILQGEEFVADMHPFQPARGDLVIFDHEGQPWVKRVVAIGGDTVEGRNSQIFVNNKQLYEPYVQHVGNRAMRESMDAFGPVTVPVGNVFVAGDNRDYSLDSRDAQFGLVPVAALRGRPIAIVNSPRQDRIGTTFK